MAQTIGGKLAAMERDCQALVAALNKSGDYQPATMIQSMLQQAGSMRNSIEQSYPEVADREFPAKST